VKKSSKPVGKFFVLPIKNFSPRQNRYLAAIDEISEDEHLDTIPIALPSRNLKHITVLTDKEPYSLHETDSNRIVKSSASDVENGEGNPLKGDEETPGDFPQSHTLYKGKMSSFYNKENGISRFKKFQLPDESIVQTPVLSHKSARGIVAMRSSKQPGGGSKHTIDIHNESKLTNIDKMKLEDSTRGIFNLGSGIKFLEYNQKDRGQDRGQTRI
jgi:hypothetical protein